MSAHAPFFADQNSSLKEPKVNLKSASSKQLSPASPKASRESHRGDVPREEFNAALRAAAEVLQYMWKACIWGSLDVIWVHFSSCWM